MSIKIANKLMWLANERQTMQLRERVNRKQSHNKEYTRQWASSIRWSLAICDVLSLQLKFGWIGNHAHMYGKSSHRMNKTTDKSLAIDPLNYQRFTCMKIMHSILGWIVILIAITVRISNEIQFQKQKKNKRSRMQGKHSNVRKEKRRKKPMEFAVP